MAWPSSLPTFDPLVPVTAEDLNDLVDALTFLHSPPGCDISVGGLTVPEGLDFDVDFATEVRDTDTMWNGGDPGKIIIKTAGLYLVDARSLFAANDVGRRLLAVAINGATHDYDHRNATVNAAETIPRVVFQRPFAVNDEITCTLFQDSGGDLGATCEIAATWQGGG